MRGTSLIPADYEADLIADNALQAVKGNAGDAHISMNESHGSRYGENFFIAAFCVIKKKRANFYSSKTFLRKFRTFL